MTAPDKPGLSNEELKPEVQAALSGGRDERWEKLEQILINMASNLDGTELGAYQADWAKGIVLMMRGISSVESMSAKEGE